MTASAIARINQANRTLTKKILCKAAKKEQPSGVEKAHAKKARYWEKYHN